MSVSNTKTSRDPYGVNKGGNKPRSAHSDVREIVETVVFVCILVNLLRMFGAEAFIIPTGSMATTLLGAHKIHECPECGHSSYFNASEQAEEGRQVLDGFCQNCRNHLDLHSSPLRTGDRVVVGKFIYDGVSDPQRWDVVVFKCLESMREGINAVPKSFPNDNRTHGVMNYIKRLVGRPGETIRIHGGDVFVRRPDESGFEIARKPPHILLAVRRLVYDNDHPAKDLQGYPRPWFSETGDSWNPSGDGKSFQCATKSEAWLRYRHLPDLRRMGPHVQPELITDFESYNDGIHDDMNWVGDLMLECSIDFETLAGKVTLQLGEGSRKYHCVFDFSQSTLSMVQNGETLAQVPNPITASGQHTVRFANFDDQLTVWVNEKLAFGNGIVTTPPTAEEVGPRVEDIDAVGIAAENCALSVSKLQIFRDLYYTQGSRRADIEPRTLRGDEESLSIWRNRLQGLDPLEFTMGPDEFFMLGDNSPRSSDSRAWRGTSFVHRRLLLGRALVLYWPYTRWKFVR